MATVVGYLVVSRPFLNLSYPRYLHSSHSELLEVSQRTHTHTHSNLQSLLGECGLSVCPGVLPEWQDAAQDVSGPGQDCAGWPRDDPPLWVSDPRQRANQEVVS